MISIQFLYPSLFIPIIISYCQCCVIIKVHYPVLDDPQDAEVASMYKKNKPVFDQTARCVVLIISLPSLVIVECGPRCLLKTRANLMKLKWVVHFVFNPYSNGRSCNLTLSFQVKKVIEMGFSREQAMVGLTNHLEQYL